MASFVISLICELFRHNNELCIGWTFSFRSEISRGHLHDESCGGKIPFDRLCKDLTKMNLSFCHPLTLVIVVHENDFVVDGLQDLPGVQLPSNLFRFRSDFQIHLSENASRPATFCSRSRILSSCYCSSSCSLSASISRKSFSAPTCTTTSIRMSPGARPRPAPSMSSIGSPLRKLAAAKARDAYAIEFARICRSNTTRSLDRSF